MQKNLTVWFLVSHLLFTLSVWGAVHAGDEGEKTEDGAEVKVSTDRSVECIQSICKAPEGISWAKQRLRKALIDLQGRIRTGKVNYSEAFYKKALSLEEKIKAKYQLEKTILAQPFDPSQVSLDADIKTLLNMSSMTALSRMLVMGSDFKLNIEASKKSLKEKGYPENVVNWLISAADFYLSPDLVESFEKSRSLEPRAYLRKVYGDEKKGAQSVLSAYQGLLKDLRDRNSQLAPILEWQSNAPGSAEMLAKLERNETLSDEQIQNLPKLDVLVRSAKRALEEKSPLKGDLFFELATVVKNQGGKDAVASRLAKQISDREAGTMRALDSCRTNYLYQREMFPTAVEVDKLKKNIDVAKSRMRENFVKGFSTETQKNLNSTLAATELYPPPSREQAEDRFKNVMTHAEASFTESIAFLKGLEGKEAKGFAEAMTALNLLQPMGSSAENICGSLLLSDFSDAMVHAGGVRLGPALAAMDAEGQLDGMLHELGHVISSQFRSGTVSHRSSHTYRKAKTCLRDLHPKKISPRSTEISDGTEFTTGELTEEDFADWAAGLALGKSETNTWCHLMNASGDGDGWEPASTIPEEGDHHSADLFRLLHHEHLRGKKLGEACQAVLKKSHDTTEVKSCKL